MSTNLGTWIAEQRAVCAVQKQRWEGVAPERLEEACSRLEVLQLVVDGRDLEVAAMRTQLAELRRELDQLRRPSVMTTGSTPAYRTEDTVLPFFLHSWRTRPWMPAGGIALSLEGALLTATPSMQTVYERCLARLAGTTINLPVC